MGTTGLGDRPADFDETFRSAYGPMVRALALAWGDAELAADCVEDAFERAFVRWRRIARYDNPVAWIRRVAINRMRDHHRRDTRRRQALARLGPGEVVDDELPDVDDGANRMLAVLPAQQRLAMALFYVEDLSVAEVAATMGLSEGAVKYHLSTARQKLRANLVEVPQRIGHR